MHAQFNFPLPRFQICPSLLQHCMEWEELWQREIRVRRDNSSFLTEVQKFHYQKIWSCEHTVLQKPLHPGLWKIQCKLGVMLKLVFKFHRTLLTDKREFYFDMICKSRTLPSAWIEEILWGGRNKARVLKARVSRSCWSKGWLVRETRL